MGDEDLGDYRLAEIISGRADQELLDRYDDRLCVADALKHALRHQRMVLDPDTERGMKILRAEQMKNQDNLGSAVTPITITEDLNRLLRPLPTENSFWVEPVRLDGFKQLMEEANAGRTFIVFVFGDERTPEGKMPTHLMYLLMDSPITQEDGDDWYMASDMQAYSKSEIDELMRETRDRLGGSVNAWELKQHPRNSEIDKS